MQSRPEWRNDMTMTFTPDEVELILEAIEVRASQFEQDGFMEILGVPSRVAEQYRELEKKIREQH